jgi:hypothetical protein
MYLTVIKTSPETDPSDDEIVNVLQIISVIR